MQTENFYVRGRKKILSPMRYDNLRPLYSKLSCPTTEPHTETCSKLDHLEVYKWYISCILLHILHTAMINTEGSIVYTLENKKHGKIYPIDQWTMTWIHPRWKSCQHLVKQAHATPNICTKRVVITPTHLMIWNKKLVNLWTIIKILAIIQINLL